MRTIERPPLGSRLLSGLTLTRGPIADFLELTLSVPLRPSGGGKYSAEVVQQSDVLGLPAEIHRWGPFIARLVVTMSVVILPTGTAGRHTTTHEIIALREGARRHPALRQREMLRAEEVSRLRRRGGSVAAALRLSGLYQVGHQRVLAVPEITHVPCWARHSQEIHVDIGYRGLQRIDGMSRVILRS